MKATAVIGACFGDEGKGLVTDYLAAQEPNHTLVVRFNGGAQAGHTVHVPGGRRHVFHHVGAGTLAGANTFLSRHFIVNPMLWSKEVYNPGIYELIDGHNVSVMIDPAAPMTTPYDMLVNQELERLRGFPRHGSCGVGINETVTRNGDRLFATYAGDMFNLDELRSKLALIREQYIPTRVDEMEIEPSKTFWARLASLELVDGFIGAAMSMQRMAKFSTWEHAIDGVDHVVFEGAQGLLLDEHHRFFPHVTRSRTGLTNVVQLAKQIGLDEVRAFYVARAYMTRHGNGPFPTERADRQFSDDTNKTNQFQGPLRFGDLDQDLIEEAINLDLTNAGKVVSVSAALAMTCLDQVNEDPSGAFAEAIGLPVTLRSYGPTRGDVRAVERKPRTSYTESLAAPGRLQDAPDDVGEQPLRQRGIPARESVLPDGRELRDGDGGRHPDRRGADLGGVRAASDGDGHGCGAAGVA